MADKSGLTQALAEKALNAFLETVEETLVKKEKISLVGFGTFEARYRAARKGQNPMTKTEILIPETYAPAFKAGKGLKDAINKG